MAIVWLHYLNLLTIIIYISYLRVINSHKGDIQHIFTAIGKFMGFASNTSYCGWVTPTDIAVRVEKPSEYYYSILPHSLLLTFLFWPQLESLSVIIDSQLELR